MVVAHYIYFSLSLYLCIIRYDSAAPTVAISRRSASLSLVLSETYYEADSFSSDSAYLLSVINFGSPIRLVALGPALPSLKLGLRDTQTAANRLHRRRMNYACLAGLTLK